MSFAFHSAHKESAISEVLRLRESDDVCLAYLYFLHSCRCHGVRVVAKSP